MTGEAKIACGCMREDLEARGVSFDLEKVRRAVKEHTKSHVVKMRRRNVQSEESAELYNML